MNVGELIEHLKAFPTDMRIVIEAEWLCVRNIEAVKEVTCISTPEGKGAEEAQVACIKVEQPTTGFLPR